MTELQLQYLKRLVKKELRKKNELRKSQHDLKSQECIN